MEKIEISKNDLHDILELFDQNKFECYPMVMDSFCEYIFNLYTYPEIPDNWRNMYELEELIKKFKEHADKADKNQKQWVDEWKRDCPNDPLPEYVQDDFNLPKALTSICIEIDKLWIAIGGR